MIATVGTLSDLREEKLPSDAMPCLFAFSLARNLRHLYTGAWFQYRQQPYPIPQPGHWATKEYPFDAFDTSKPAYLTKIYDQKARHGVPVADAWQTDPTKQPSLTYSGVVVATFDLGQYLDVPNIAPFLGSNFTLTSVGRGDIPRPMVGVWGENDMVTVEPGDPTSRFTFNANHGSITAGGNDSVMSCYAGEDPKQNGRVLSVRTGSGESGHVIKAEPTPSFTNISIGRAGDRMFKGEFTEAYMHLDDLTKIGADKQFETARAQYG